MTGNCKLRLGVIGGLGPLASADFYRKITLLTPATKDQDHLSLALLSLPDLPDRSSAILDRQDAPLDSLLEAVAMLNAMGVECIAMPCNTAHHWYGTLTAASKADIIHIVDSVLADLKERGCGLRVALLATQGTLASGFYQSRLMDCGYRICLPRGAAFQSRVDSAVALVKAGVLDRALADLRRAVQYCVEADADVAILACTELSVLSDQLTESPIEVVDSNEALARSSLRRLGIAPFGVTAVSSPTGLTA
jgi:aspartate racemase